MEVGHAASQSRSTFLASFVAIGCSLTAKMPSVGACNIFLMRPEFLLLRRRFSVIISSSFTLKFYVALAAAEEEVIDDED